MLEGKLVVIRDRLHFYNGRAGIVTRSLSHLGKWWSDYWEMKLDTGTKTIVRTREVVVSQ